MIDRDGLPTFPPLPTGTAIAPGTASLLRLVQSLDIGALEVADEGLHALVLFDDRRVIDGYLESPAGGVTGADVLDHLDCRPVTSARLYKLSPSLLRILKCWWRLPSQITIGPSRWMDGELLLRSFARPGQRGLVCVCAGEDRLGVVFVEDGEIVGAYRGDGDQVGGVEEVLHLFNDPSVELFGRLEEISNQAAADVASDRLLAEIEQSIRAEMHDYAEPAIAIFRSASRTREGMLEAARQVAQMRIRMISAERMQAVADITRRLIDQSM